MKFLRYGLILLLPSFIFVLMPASASKSYYQTSYIPAWLYGDYDSSGGDRVGEGDCVAAYIPLGAVSYTDSKTNIAEPGFFDLVEGNENIPYWTTLDGWTFTGSEYLLTGLVIPNDQSYSAIVRFSGVSGYQGFVTRSISTGGIGVSYWGIQPNRNDYQVGWWAGSTGILRQAPGMLEGVLAVAGNQGYRNGIQAPGILAAPTNTLGELGIGQSASVYVGKVQAVFVYDIVLTAQQVAGITAAMTAINPSGNWYLPYIEPTSTPTAVTPTATPGYIQEIPLASGNSLLVDRRISYGDISAVLVLMVGIGLGLIGFSFYVARREGL